MVTILVDMHHAIEEGPEENICEEATDKPPSEKWPSGFKVLIPPPSSFQYQKHGEKDRSQEVEDKAM